MKWRERLCSSLYSLNTFLSLKWICCNIIFVTETPYFISLTVLYTFSTLTGFLDSSFRFEPQSFWFILISYVYVVFYLYFIVDLQMDFCVYVDISSPVLPSFYLTTRKQLCCKCFHY